MSMRRKLANKGVVVTGGAHGIGKALVNKLLEEGARVVALDINAPGLAALQDDADKFALPLQTVKVDLADSADLESAYARCLEILGPIDIWINNAGVNGTGDFTELSLEEFEKVVGVNFVSLTRATRLALTGMNAAGRGLIVNMASVAGIVEAPLMSAYVATKHAVVGFTRALQAELELKDSPTRTLLVCPGFVDTGIIEKGSKMGFPDWLSWMLSTPDTVAAAVVRGIKAGESEIVPTMSGKLMLGMYKTARRTTVKSSRVLLAKSWKDVLLNRYEL
jgi:all-trans-retinol dehydrogenase (NAD+)